MIKEGLRNAVAGLTALVLAGGCATTGSNVRSEEDAKWVEGVTETLVDGDKRSEAVGCSRAKTIDLARTSAMGRARTSLARYVYGNPNIDVEMGNTQLIDAGIRESDGAYCVRVRY